MLAEPAQALAARLLGSALPRRWAHVKGVASAATDTAGELGGDGDALIAAAWLHDIGYSPELAHTGLHALDAARYLRDLGWDNHVVTLVAHHSASCVEAAERGVAEELLMEFPEPTDRTQLELLWYCDMTTGPTGARVSVEDRLAEIRHRYGSDSIVTRFVERAEAQLVGAVRRVERRLAEAAPSRGMAPLGGSEGT